MRYLLLITTPLFAFTALFAGDLLAAWVGPRFAAEAAVPLQLLAVAFYLGGFAHILRSAVQGLGRPDLKAGLDLANAGLFLALLLALTPRLGVAGAAVARLAMAATELAGLCVLASRVAPGALAPAPLARALRFDLAASASFAIAAALAAEALGGSPLSYVVFALCATAHVIVFWKWSSDARDRRAVAQLRDWLGRRGRGDLLASADAGDGP
jgi:O-antigen/teichoic acid export membrane protein